MMAVGLDDGRCMVIDAVTWVEKWAVQAHPHGADRLGWVKAAMSPDGSLVASVSRDDPQWKLWNSASGELHLQGFTHDGSGACICEVPALCDPVVVQEGCPVVAHTWGICSLAFSPCGQRMATGGDDHLVILWDTHTGDALHIMVGPFRNVFRVSFSADGSRLSVGCFDRTIRICDVASGELLHTILADFGESTYDLNFSPTDHRTMATVGHNKIVLWDVFTGEKIRSCAGQYLAVFSPDGRTIATTNRENYIILIDAGTGDLLGSWRGHADLISSVSFSCDGSMLASSSNDGYCKVWDSSSGAILGTIIIPFEAGTIIINLTWGRDWVRDTQTSLAFAMGHHPRLGAGSQVRGLDEELLRMILDRA
jgi:WD40 repeat protein